MKKKVNEPIKENIQDVKIEKMMGSAFGEYAKSIIQDRAIPDARDGLKPVQRRIIYDMSITGTTYDKPTKKSAKVVGSVMGTWHPHGKTFN